MYPLISTCWVGRAYGTLKMQSLVFCVFLLCCGKEKHLCGKFFEEKEFPGRLSLT